VRTGISRRLFVVPLADNAHGKSTIVRHFLNQAEHAAHEKPQKAARRLVTPWGREVDAFIFVRSYQETLARSYGSIRAALDAEDPSWRARELIFLPSHLNTADCTQLLDHAHQAGFDAIVVSILLEEGELLQHAACLGLSWDERWTLLNTRADTWEPQARSLASDLWTWISAALTRQ
jgi:hypothetical protein